MLSFAKERLMADAAHLPGLSTRKSKPSWPRKPRRSARHAARDKAEHRPIYIAARIVVAAMIAFFARAFMQPPIRS